MDKKAAKYERLYLQIEELLKKSTDRDARMATVSAVLHHKMPNFFWTGYYLLKDGKLIVKSYQGPVACMELAQNKGVCWACVNQRKSLVVPDVHDFPDHIACDSRSNSEIVIPLKDAQGEIYGVLDIDSTEFNNFDETDLVYLEKIVSLL